VATIVDVARVAGVSVQTVSAVLNDKAGISEATRARVRHIIQDLDYQPNQLASSLRSQRSRTVGILVPSITNPYWPEIVRGAEDVAHQAGYAVFLCNTDGDPDKHRAYVRVLRRHRVAGIFVTDSGDLEDLEGLLRSGSQVAVSGAKGAFGSLITLGVDDYQIGYTATCHLLDLGHRRIGCIAPLDHAGEGRRRGYAQAMRERGVTTVDELLIHAQFDIPSGQAGARQLMRLAWPPTAIVAGNDLIAIGAITTLKALGKRVPEDVAVVGVDNIPLAALYDPPITTVAQPLYEMGAFAMQAILDRVLDPALEGTHTTFATPLIVRRSTVATAEEMEEPQPGAALGTRTPGLGNEHQPVAHKEVPIG
jgi:LacI family transcriptional regulator